MERLCSRGQGGSQNPRLCVSGGHAAEHPTLSGRMRPPVASDALPASPGLAFPRARCCLGRCHLKVRLGLAVCLQVTVHTGSKPWPLPPWPPLRARPLPAPARPLPGRAPPHVRAARASSPQGRSLPGASAPRTQGRGCDPVYDRAPEIRTAPCPTCVCAPHGLIRRGWEHAAAGTPAGDTRALQEVGCQARAKLRESRK